MADVTYFEQELIAKLKYDRVLFIHEILSVGKSYGLSESQVERILDQAEASGIGFREEAFIYIEDDKKGKEAEECQTGK